MNDMSHYDVFNGDADGLCALHQLRLDDPVEAELVTGVKRDITLLDRVRASTGDQVTVLDISLDSNRSALMRLLDAGAQVEYFDHHHAGQIPKNARLITHIDLSADVCTAILVDRHLQGRHRLWAIVAAFGDNLAQSGRTLAQAKELPEAQIEKLSRLGEYLNYNGYGDDLEDLHFHPLVLYREMKPYSDPFVFIAESPVFSRLEAGFNDDIGLVDSLHPLREEGHCSAYLLPDAPWARRVSGVLANRLANENPSRAHAVITPDRYGSYSVSVRASKDNPDYADTLCLKFKGGGGRTAAAGINRLPGNELDRFLILFAQQFG